MTSSHTGKCLFYLSNGDGADEKKLLLESVDDKRFTTTAKWDNVFFYHLLSSLMFLLPFRR